MTLAFHVAASGTPVGTYLALALSIVLVAGLGAMVNARGRRVLVALLVVGFLTAGVSAAWAIPYGYCDMVLRYLGLCR